MMDAFMRLANSNTKKDLETCGILAGSLVSCYMHISFYYSNLKNEVWKSANNDLWITRMQKNRKFYITALIIPKQESTSNSVSSVLFWYFNLVKSFFTYANLKTLFYRSLYSVRPQTKRRYLKYRTSNPFSHLDGFMWVICIVNVWRSVFFFNIVFIGWVGVIYSFTDSLITVSLSSDASDTVLFHVIHWCPHPLFIPGTGNNRSK